MFLYLVTILNQFNIYHHCVCTLLIVCVQGGGVRKVHSKVNMRGKSAVDNHRAHCPAPRQPRMLPSFEETRQSPKESVRMKTFQTSLNMFPSSRPDLTQRGRRRRMWRQMGGCLDKVGRWS